MNESKRQSRTMYGYIFDFVIGEPPWRWTRYENGKQYMFRNLPEVISWCKKHQQGPVRDMTI